VILPQIAHVKYLGLSTTTTDQARSTACIVSPCAFFLFAHCDGLKMISAAHAQKIGSGAH
jgi:hypothetical protein